jgi:GH15 family glucan-1,4-alpha-glucosidase
VLTVLLLVGGSIRPPGRLNGAQLAFEKMLTYGSHFGMYSGEIGPTGEQLCNFPEAFGHQALISAVYNLDHRLG